MRINRLDLTRYGRFTDHVLDFGTAQAGQPDLHIIYGPNEAGKSTTFSALLDLLFGIEHKSRYNFLHPYPAMKIGASLQMQSGLQELTRTKARINSLQDEAGRALPDTLITAELGDIDRDAYRMMFSLDDDTLEQGGEAILASKGNLGELLFSASAGLAGLSQNLAKLRGQSEQFYRPNARSGQLTELKAQLQNIETQKAELDARTSAQAYGKLADAHRLAQDEYQQALRDHVATRDCIAQTEARLNALPRLHRLHNLQLQLSNFSDVPAVPLGWAEELPKLMVQDVELRTKTQAHSANSQALLFEIAEIRPDELALRIAGSAEHLQVLRARFLTAEKDLPERDSALRAEQQTIHTLCMRLGQNDKTEPHSLLIHVQAETELRGLIESRSGIEAALLLTGKELAAAEERLTGMRERLEHAGAPFNNDQDAHFMALNTLLARLRSEDHTSFLQQAISTAREEQAELQSLWQAMPYIRKDESDDLAAVLTCFAQQTAPDTTVIEDAGDALQKLQTRLQQTEAGLEENRKESTQISAQLEALQENNLLISEEQAVHLRHSRDIAWQQHRSTLDQETADKFELLLTQDDAAVHRRLTHASEVARALQLRERLAVMNAQCKLAEQTRNALVTQVEEYKGRLAHWQQQILPDFSDELSAASLLRWLEKRDVLLQKRNSWLRACRLRDDRQQQVQDSEAALIKALNNIGARAVSDNLTHLLQQATALSEQIHQAASLQAAFAERLQEMQQRQKGADIASQEDKEWQQAWQLACQKTWLGQEGAIPALDQVRAILNLTAELAPALERSADLSQRIAKMQQDQAAYRKEVEALAQRLQISLLGVSGQPLPLMEIAAQVDQCVRTALDQSQKLQDLNRKFEQAEQDMQILEQHIAVADARKTEILSYFDADNLMQAGQKIQQAKEKSALEEACETEAQNIVTMLKTTELSEAENLLAQADSAALKAQLQELHVQDQAEDQHKQEQYRLWKQAEQSLREAQSGDDSAAQLDEQRRTILLEIEERAKRYLRLRFGITAAEQALRLYRDQHRSTMMAQASEAFATISQGAYRQLTTQTDRDNEILIAIAADGGSKTAEELSKGTRFQLYLALRVAGYYEFIHAQRPMPFIADDIMETFDDDRARETFRIFAQMAQQGQVIYLTHHQHLCDIARDACPNVRLHELTPRLRA